MGGEVDGIGTQAARPTGLVWRPGLHGRSTVASGCDACAPSSPRRGCGVWTATGPEQMSHLQYDMQPQW